MARKLCSVVMATFQRAHLLCRSVEGYNRSDFPLDQLEVVVVDDGSTDATADVCGLFDPRIDVKYVRLRKTPGLWRDCGAVIGVGLRASHAECVLMTHPEIMPGRRSIAACVDNLLADRRAYACCRAYYTSPRDMERIDTVPWAEEGPLALRKIEGFYDREQHKHGHPDYTPWSIETIETWESWVFGGHHRDTWKSLGGMCVSERWGSVDLIWLHRRRVLGIPNLTAKGDDTICAHLNHDLPGQNVVTPRDIGKAHEEAGRFQMTPATARYPAVDELW